MWRRIEQRHERAIGYGEQRVGADERAPQRRRTIRLFVQPPLGDVLESDPKLPHVAGCLDAKPHDTGDRPALAGHSRHHLACIVVHRLDLAHSYDLEVVYALGERLTHR
jgi:hypothetical protein